MLRPRFVLLFLLPLAGLTVGSARAQWAPNGLAVCSAPDNQQYPAIAADGFGGTFLVWNDRRNGTDEDVYSQHLDAAGVPQWGPNGILVASGSSAQIYPAILGDGTGGAFVGWWDYRSGTNFDIYAQHLNPAGTPTWGPGGVPVCTAAQNQVDARLVTDNAGGAIVTWQDYRSGTYYRLFAQRLDGAGNRLWMTDGVLLSSYSAPLTHQSIADGTGGAIVTLARGDVYAQRIDASGALLWSANGRPVCYEPNDQSFVSLVPSGSGGAIFAWDDDRNAPQFPWDPPAPHIVYAQCLDGAGNALWASGGVPVCPGSGAGQTLPTAASDGASGAIVAWCDGRPGASGIYAQRISAVGALQWSTAGVSLSSAGGNAVYPAAAGDGAGGAVFAWGDSRNGTSDIFAQRVSAAGVPLWLANGVPVCVAPNSQQIPKLVPDGLTGVVITWYDPRNGNSNIDVYAQRVGADGVPGSTADVPAEGSGIFRLLGARPNPARSGVAFEFHLAAGAAVTIDVLDIQGRQVSRLVGDRDFSAGPHTISWNCRTSVGDAAASGVYFVRFVVGGERHFRRVVLFR